MRISVSWVGLYDYAQCFAVRVRSFLAVGEINRTPVVHWVLSLILRDIRIACMRVEFDLTRWLNCKRVAFDLTRHPDFI